ncbi:MAG: phosphoadenylyl-sulfate reductase [Gammaproteobacteria bacterium]|nr:phosphoadenylyl-sulfate reductase [Gammaproteobacteria bacterium]
MSAKSAEIRQSRPSETSPAEVIAMAFEQHAHDRIAISFSGAEDVVLIDMAHRLGIRPRVFSLDTGRLHPDTYRFIETVRDHYGLDIDMLMPDAAQVATLVRSKGLFSFYRDGHQECCAIRKISPLRQHLTTLDAWVTGQRRDQSVTRADVPLVQHDQAFSTANHAVEKYNPLADWSSAQVWSYIRENEVPYNPLHDRGFMSIGCEPCTRAIAPHEHERNGRWWWEQADGKECGLHAQNVRPVRIVG